MIIKSNIEHEIKGMCIHSLSAANLNNFIHVRGQFVTATQYYIYQSAYSQNLSTINHNLKGW